jgi:serine/threonine protein phosphatase 1
VWKWSSPRPAKRRARVPDGTRIYAIGDVHGRADLLSEVFASIDGDLAADPTRRPIEVFLGDYVDRGPSSCEVLDMLVERNRTRETVLLRGNHEFLFLEFLKNPRVLDDWRRYGGLDTLMSYGLRPSLRTDAQTHVELAAALRDVLPPSHRSLLAALRPSFMCGDFFFVHAGIRPGIPFAQQRDHDLLWIREDFLSHEDDFGKIVVHGHTPVLQPEIRSNRINIDTGAYATGQLTCLRLQGDRMRFI